MFVQLNKFVIVKIKYLLNYRIQNNLNIFLTRKRKIIKQRCFRSQEESSTI